MWWPAASPDPLQGCPTAHLAVPQPPGQGRDGARQRCQRRGWGATAFCFSCWKWPHSLASNSSQRTSWSCLAFDNSFLCHWLPMCLWIWVSRAKGVIINSSKICHFLMCRCGCFVWSFFVSFFSYQQNLDCGFMLRCWEINLILE